MKLPTAANYEPHTSSQSSKSNWLRASVLGANDGIVSLAALVVGVAGATTDAAHILVTGTAGLLAGALSMAVGEYVSVSSQRDTELALLAKERGELRNAPETEIEELTTIYEKKGLSRPTAEAVAKELTAHDVFAAHIEAELRIDPKELTSPWQAAVASGLAFTTGAVIPMVAIMLPPDSLRVPVTFASVFIALVITGVLSAYVSGASVSRVTSRVVFGGIAAMVVTFGIGKLFGVSGV